MTSSPQGLSQYCDISKFWQLTDGWVGVELEGYKENAKNWLQGEKAQSGLDARQEGLGKNKKPGHRWITE